MTLLEILIVVVLVSILVISISMTMGNKIHKARLARCFSEMRSIQSTVFLELAEGNHIPLPEELWSHRWHGRKPGPYFYFGDNEDPDKGHGNDIDKYDESNPGGAPRKTKDLKFIIFCQHNHGSLARYVYVEDEGKPTLAVSNNFPSYDKLLLTGGGGGGGGPPGGGPGK